MMSTLLQQRERSISPNSTSSLSPSVNNKLNPHCTLFNKCKHINNIQKELHFYQYLMNDDEKNHDTLLQRDISSIINGYQHILNHHLSSQILNNNIEFEFIYNKLTKHIKCDIKTCNKYRTHIQRSTSDCNIQSNQDINVVFRIDLLNAIHTHLIHSYDMGIRETLSTEVKNKNTKTTYDTSPYCLQLYQGGRLKFNAKRYITNFTDEKTHSSDSDYKTETNDESSSISSMPDLSNTKNYTSSDMTFEFSHKASVNSSFPFSMQSSMHSITPKDSNANAAINKAKINARKTNIYGITYYYWIYFKNNNNMDPVNPGCKYSDLYIKSKHKNLKTELLNNKMSKQQYDSAMFKANQYLKHSKYLKTIHSIECIEYNIKLNTFLNENNVLALTIYSDYDHLSYELRKSFTKPNNLKHAKILKTQQKQFWNLAKTLKETVHCFSSNNTANKTNNILYHGCNNKTIFSKFNLYFSAPTSFTPYNYIKPYINGMLLEINHNDLTYFNCNMISFYAYENELLFFGGNTAMKLHNFHLDYNLSVNFTDFIEEMVVFDHALSNKYDTKTKIDFKILSQLIAFHSKQNIIKLLLDVNLLLMN
eukprot:402501_1